MKDKGGDWKMMTGLSDKWKNEARFILKLAVDRIAGSLIEEKDYSMAWHYRNADSRITERHIREIVNDLLNLTANSNLKVLEGSKVVEVKSANLNKGSTAQQWLSRQNWDFVLAIGDDVTDEDMFQALSVNAWSIKVRPGVSAARFSLESPDDVRALLKEIMVK
jgi:trehalose 6-phosphate synthase/phosphatase